MYPYLLKQVIRDETQFVLKTYSLILGYLCIQDITVLVLPIVISRHSDSIPPPSWFSASIGLPNRSDTNSTTMMTSSNGNIFRVIGPLCGQFIGPGESPTQRPVTRSFDVFFDLRLNKRLCKQPWGWWFETPSWSLWRHRNGLSVLPCLHMVTMQLNWINLAFIH